MFIYKFPWFLSVQTQLMLNVHHLCTVMLIVKFNLQFIRFFKQRLLGKPASPYPRTHNDIRTQTRTHRYAINCGRQWANASCAFHANATQ